MRSANSESENVKDNNEDKIEISRQPRELERKLRAFVGSRKGVQVIAWSITFVVTLLLLIFVAPGDDTAEQMVCIVSSLLISISATVSILARYVWLEHFPPSAFLNIGAAFVLSFFQIGLAATDIAFTRKSRANANHESHEQLQDLMRALWFFVYWGTVLTGSVLMQFYKLYWTSG